MAYTSLAREDNNKGRQLFRGYAEELFTTTPRSEGERSGGGIAPLKNKKY